MLVTEKLKREIKETCLKDLRSLGITESMIDNNINEPTDLDYMASLGLSDYIGLTKEDTVKKAQELNAAGKFEEIEKIIALSQVANMLSIYWILCNGVRFAIDLDRTMKRNYGPDQELMKMLKKTSVEDYIFDFFGNNIREQCRLQKQHDLIRVNGKFYPHWIFSYSVVTNNERFGTFELCIVPDLFPRMFVVNPLTTDICTKCGICRKVEDACFKHLDGSTDDSIKILRMPKNLQYTLESNCKYKDISDDVGPFLTHNIRDYLNSCLYAVDKYLKRKTITKQLPEDSINECVKVAVPKENKPGEVTFVTLRDRVRYERRQKRVHGHHSSPREHVRRATERHLKDGRVVPVKGCVINKGKGDVKKQTVYKIV